MAASVIRGSLDPHNVWDAWYYGIFEGLLQ